MPPSSKCAMPTSVTPVNGLSPGVMKPPSGGGTSCVISTWTFCSGLVVTTWRGKQVHAREFVERVDGGRDFRAAATSTNLVSNDVGGFDVDRAARKATAATRKASAGGAGISRCGMLAQRRGWCRVRARSCLPRSRAGARKRGGEDGWPFHGSSFPRGLKRQRRGWMSRPTRSALRTMPTNTPPASNTAATLKRAARNRRNTRAAGSSGATTSGGRRA